MCSSDLGRWLPKRPQAEHFPSSWGEIMLASSAYTVQSGLCIPVICHMPTRLTLQLGPWSPHLAFATAEGTQKEGTSHCYRSRVVWFGTVGSPGFPNRHRRDLKWKVVKGIVAMPPIEIGSLSFESDRHIYSWLERCSLLVYYSN